MLGPGFATYVLAPAAAGQPHALHRLLEWGMRLWLTAPAAADGLAAAIQIVIGVLLLVPDPRWRRRGLWLSMGWGLLVWVFGEGLGGILQAGASGLGGSPGSVLLYVVLALILLGWREERAGGRRLQVALAAYLAVSALATWRGGAPGVAAALAATVGMPLPVLLADPVRWALTVAANHSAAAVAVAVAVPAVLALFWFRRRPSPGLWEATALWLFITWWAGMGFGVLGGFGTDPNTAPLAGTLWAGGAQGSLDGPRERAVPTAPPGRQRISPEEIPWSPADVSVTGIRETGRGHS
jgi:hypothetical protein